MSEPLRAAIIGCGGIAERHARGFSVAGRCEVVAACDINEINLHRTCDRAGIPSRFSDAREMLEVIKPDVVAICTWPQSHASLTADAAHVGVKGILCEKPMAMSLGECDAMIAACDSAGARLGIGHHYRFQPAIVQAKEILAAGGIGEVILARGTCGEGLHNSASHHVDLCRFLLDDPEPAWVFGQVERLTDRYERGAPIEDCGLGEIGFTDGQRLLIESDLFTESAELHLYGMRGTLRIVRSKAYLLDPAAGWQPVQGAGESAQHTAFLDWLEGGPLYPSNAENGRAVIECLNGLFASARLRRRVAFPLHEQEYPLPAMIQSGDWPVEQSGAYDIRAGGPRWRNER